MTRQPLDVGKTVVRGGDKTGASPYAPPVSSRSRPGQPVPTTTHKNPNSPLAQPIRRMGGHSSKGERRIARADSPDSHACLQAAPRVQSFSVVFVSLSGHTAELQVTPLRGRYGFLRMGTGTLPVYEAGYVRPPNPTVRGTKGNKRWLGRNGEVSSDRASLQRLGSEVTLG